MLLPGKSKNKRNLRTFPALEPLVSILVTFKSVWQKGHFREHAFGAVLRGRTG